ncbi:MAG: helix-turn-helix domain-containing protein [Candidatus Krumholzibacteriota bacterium]|nr:helix-turn-helix domain-containing protein [Candidatus Krumholzibacteriota bacterium]
MVRSWTTDSGLPHNDIRAMVQTNDGYLYLGTAAGLARFDGVRFMVFNQENTPVLKNNRILSLHQDIYSVLWVGTDGGGLYALREGRWEEFEGQEWFEDRHIRALISDRRGNLWIGTEHGLHLWDGKNIRSYGLEEGLADDLITSLLLDGWGNIWAGTMWGGLAGIEDGRIRVFDYGDGLADQTVLSLHADWRGRVWIGTMEGLFSLQPEEGRIFPVDRDSDYPVTALEGGTNGELIVGTMVEGLQLLEDSSLRDLVPGEEQGNCHIRALLTDRQGQTWVGTASRGLKQIKERKAGSLTEKDGLPAGSIHTLLEDGAGALWIGSENSGLYRMRGGVINKVMDSSGGLAGDIVRSLLLDRSGRLWVGTLDGGISIMQGAKVENLSGRDGLISDNITSLLEDQEGAVWIGTNRGLCCYLNGKIAVNGKCLSLADQFVRTLYQNDRGVLFAGTRNGIWKQDTDSFQRITAEELDVLSLHQDTNGRLWAGTNGEGLKCLSDGKINGFSIKDGMPGNFIYSISEVDSGLAWFSCENGVFSVHLDSLRAYGEGSAPLLAAALYDDCEGMPASRCSGFCDPAVCISRTGKIYYPTTGGVAYFPRERPGKKAQAPPVLIESIAVNDIDQETNTDIEMSSSSRIEFRFTAFDYAAPEKIRFLFRLEGERSVLTPLYPSQERMALFRHLPPGEYWFSVRALGNSGLWSTNTATASFVINKPFYRTATFLILLALGIILAGATAALIRGHRQISRQKKKYSTTTIDAERMDKALVRLISLMEEERLYLDPDLTLKKLAGELKIHYNQLSRIINERFSVGFSDYINRYRVSAAKEILSDPALQGKTILDIMYDCGFYSKSTFNTAFKKFTGLTPSKFRKRNG